MKRVVAVLVIAAIAIVSWLTWPSETGHDAVGTKPSAAVVPPPPEVPRVRPPRVRGETPPPVPDAEPKTAPVAEPDVEPTAAKYPLTVIVLRSDGTPAKSAAVLLVGPDDDGNPSAAGNTDADGRVVLRAGEDPVRVVAWLGAEAGAPKDLFSPKEQGAVTVRLGPSVVVRGRVTMDGKPVWGADVTVTAQPWFGSDFGLVLAAKTNAGGEFVMSPIPEAGIDPLNPPYVEATTHDLGTGYAETELDLLRRGGEVVVELVRAFTVRARFVDVEGGPVAGVIVCPARDRRRESVSQADGRIAMRLPHANSISLVALWPDRRRESAESQPDVVPRLESWYEARSLGTLTEPRGTIDLGDVVLAPGKPVSGVVVDSGGRPAAHVHVSLYLDGIAAGFAETDERGAFVLPPAGPDPHRLVVWQPDANDPTTMSARASVDGVKGGDSDLRIVLEETLEIVVRFLAEKDRTPLACAAYSIKAKLHGDGYDWFGTEVAAGGDESYAFTVFTPGSYDVVVDVAGYEPLRFESVEVIAGRAPTLDLLLRKKPN